MAKVLVTGGAGFIGSNMVEALIQNSDQVRVLDDFSTGKKENLELFGSQVDIVEGDLRRAEDVSRAVQGMDYVIHMGAMRAVLRSVDDPRETNDVNVTGTLNVLMAAKESRVKRVVFSSSSSIYGDTEKFPCEEDDKPNPMSPYAASKMMGEYYSRLFYELYGLDTASLRYFNVFGPRQNPESKYSAVIPIFIECLLKETSPEIHWDGKQSRDFSYIDNIVAGNLLAIKAKQTQGNAYNIACSEEFSVLDIFENLKEILKKPSVEPTFKPKRAGDVRRTFANIDKAKRNLGFKAQTRFREGLEKTVSWFLSSGILKKQS